MDVRVRFGIKSGLDIPAEYTKFPSFRRSIFWKMMLHLQL